jgi:hypothetical protein
MSKKITLALAAFAALSLSASPTMSACPDELAARTPDPTKPKVSVVDGQYIVVDQEPLVFTAKHRKVIITWQLPREGGYRFPKDGITFSDGKKRNGLLATIDKEIGECAASEDGLAFTCVNRHEKPGNHKYTIKVKKDGKELKPLDPHIDNY